MEDESSILPPPKRTPWSKGKLIGAKPPLLARHVWSIRTKLDTSFTAHRRRSFRAAASAASLSCARRSSQNAPSCARRRASACRLAR